MGTPVDFWSLEDCVKGLSELRDGRSNEGTVEKANSRARELLASQMSGCSGSEDAIRQMLAEKERDLELAAQIGSRLLEQNKDLERRLETLDTQLLSANDRAQQLRHELSQKEQLVQVYSQICEEVQGDDVWPTRTPPQPSPKHFSSSLSSCSDPMSTPSDFFSPRCPKRGVLSTGLDQLHMQISLLEEENNRLRLEHDQLLTDRRNKEEKSLVEDCLRQLADTNTHIKTLSDDLTKKTDKFMERQVEVGDLIDRSVQMEHRVKLLTDENMALTNRLEDAQGSQMTLSDQLIDLRDKYDQCLSMLSDAHTEIRRVSHQQQQASPCLSANMSPARPPPPVISTPTDLATELQASLLAEVEEDDEAPMFLPSVASCSDMPKREDGATGTAGLRRSSYPWDLRHDDLPLSASSSSSASCSGDEEAPGACRLRRTRKGRAGKHQKSSRRLQQQPQVVSESQRWSPAIRGSSQPLQDKVQMVKSMEGSTTLKQWQRLARPSMSGALFERRPGVRVRGCSGNRMSGLGGLGGLGGLLGSDDSGEEEKEAESARTTARVEEKRGKGDAAERKSARTAERVEEKRGKGDAAERKEEEGPATMQRVVFGLGGLGMESATPEPSPRHERGEPSHEQFPRHERAASPAQVEEEEEEMGREVAAITVRMSSAPPDPTRTLDALNHRRAAAEKTSPLAAPLGRSSTPTGSLSDQKPIALSHHGFSSSNLAAILNEKGIRSKTYEQLLGEGYPVPKPQSTPATQAACPTTPRNSPSEEIEERYTRERTPGPVNPTLVFTGLMESLSEIFKPFGSLTSLRDEETDSKGGLRRNTSTGSNLDGLNALAAKPAPVAAVLHRTDASAASPRKK